MAADARLSIWAQVQAERTRGTGDRRRNEYRSLSIVPSKQVRRALSTAKHLMQAIFGDRIGEIWIPGPWSARKRSSGVFASRISFITTSLAIGPRCTIRAISIRRQTCTSAGSGDVLRSAHAVPPGPQMIFNSACRLSFFTTDIARSSAPGSDPGSSTRSP